MTFRELALKSVDSYAMYSLSGQIDCVLDITEPRALQPFIEVTRNFRVPKKIAQWAKTFSQSPLGVVQSVEELEQFLMLYDWRKIPLLLGVLSHSQQLGRDARAAGIEAIRYLSVKSHKPCLAVFPENLAHSDSYVELDDPTPPEYPALIRRLDSTSWSKLV